ncbi:hypothetical protein C1884_20080 [Pseudomonas sp. GW460-R15]|nr:hypothetical protein C1887_29440 [Pseudomonas sp. GW456-R21]POA64674.1 hypothetical protein C1884_20080 [Pseudomonas sp. GW460-R15]
MRRIVCRRFGVSICLRDGAAGCKNDRGIAESVNTRQRVSPQALCPPVLSRIVGPEFAASLDASLEQGAATQ